MEIEHAKIILSSFRSDGKDASDEGFAEALALAAEDRLLGEWLATERAKDAVFSEALQSVSIPEGLRDEILAAVNDDVLLEEDPELDYLFSSALLEVKPPEELKDQILVAMDQDQKVVKGMFTGWKVLSYAAAAVVALLGVLVFTPVGPVPSVADAWLENETDKRVHAFNIQQKVGIDLNEGHVKFVSNSLEDSMKWLESKNLPVVEVPEALKSMKCMGSTSIDVGEGVEGSLLRFMSKEGKEVNLLVVTKKHVKNLDDIPASAKSCVKDSYFCDRCDYWIARMQEDDALVMVLSQLGKEETPNVLISL